jgi:hypothetical protein
MPVRGWLLGLCILLTIWNPATLAVVAASRVGSMTPPSTISLALLAVRVVVTGIGVAAGMALWHKRAGAVPLAKASLVLSALEITGRLSTREGLSEAPPGTRLPLALAQIVFNAAWYLYLEKSRRVRATYGLESRH